jgi:hypothetical protein
MLERRPKPKRVENSNEYKPRRLGENDRTVITGTKRLEGKTGLKKPEVNEMNGKTGKLDWKRLDWKKTGVEKDWTGKILDWKNTRLEKY